MRQPHKSKNAIILIAAPILIFFIYFTLSPLYKASPENEASIIRKNLSLIMEQTPAYIVYPYNKRPVKEILNGFVQSKILEDSTKIIKQGKKVAENYHFALIMLPDMHHTLDGQCQDSLLRQQEIVRYIQSSKIKLLLAEGIDIELTWENLYEEALKYVKEKSEFYMPVSDSLEDFKKDFFSKIGIKPWYSAFMEDPVKRAVGVEYKDLTVFCRLLESLEQMPYVSPFTHNLIGSTFNRMNAGIREQVILARIAMIMQTHSQRKGIIVLGFNHEKTFARLCRDWSVDIEVHRF